MILSREVEALEGVKHGDLDGRRLFDTVEIVRYRNAGLKQVIAGIAVVHIYKPLRIGIRKWLQQYRVHRAEDRAVGANT